ncbi:hypothetical protein Tco_0914985 [Tanacetum coccineum]
MQEGFIPSATSAATWWRWSNQGLTRVLGALEVRYEVRACHVAGSSVLGTVAVRGSVFEYSRRTREALSLVGKGINEQSMIRYQVGFSSQ